MYRKAATNLLSIIGATVLISTAVGQSKSVYDAARRKMVDEVIIGAGVRDVRVIDAMLATPRHEFVNINLRPQAYFDMALPIGGHQTISSPFIVAYMTQSLDPKPTDKVLEIGTGSGYQAAVLSPIVKEVYSIEIVESLGRKAARTLKRLDYDNVFTKVGDGYLGWPEHAPFDKIIVTCSPEKVPQPLVDQLKEGGLIVVPVGERYQQTLYLLRKTNGEMKAEALRPTLFVPMTGSAESKRVVKPDPSNPSLENGGFEEEVGENGFVPGWYYQRQLTWQTDPKSPEGTHHVSIINRESGRAAHVMQGFAVDGREVDKLDVSAWIKTTEAYKGDHREAVPMIAISFYDENRSDLGVAILGPFLGNNEWHKVERKISISPKAREGIIRLGLFGATGEISFDDVRMKRSE